LPLQEMVSFTFSEGILEPLTKLSARFSPLPQSLNWFRANVRKGEVLELYFNDVRQGVFIISTVTTTISASSGYEIEVEAHHPIKLLYEARLNSTYSKQFKTSGYTLKQLVSDVAGKVLAGLVTDTVATPDEADFSINGTPIFVDDDTIEGDQKIAYSYKSGTPKSRWSHIRLTEAQAQFNETAYQFLARQCTRYGLLLRPASNGGFMLTKPCAEGNPAWILGQHSSGVLTGRFLDSFTETDTNDGQFSRVEVTGAAGTKPGYADNILLMSVAPTATAIAKGRATSAELPERSRYRPGTWLLEKPMYVKDRSASDTTKANNAARLALGLTAKDAYKLSATLDGIADSVGNIYCINRLADVWVECLGINEDMLVLTRKVTVDYSGGQRTDIELIPKGALILEET